MHALAPYNTDALYLLMKTWAGYGAGFIVDEIERAQDKGDDAMEDYQRKRARMAFDRAIFYGLQLMAQTAEGFEGAKKNEMTLTKWLNENFKSVDDAPNLLWTGVAWLSRADVMKGDEDEGPIFISDVYVGVALIQRAVDLDPSVDHYTGLIAMASYHARNGMAEPEEGEEDPRHGDGEDRGQEPHGPPHVRDDVRLREGRLGPLPADARQGPQRRRSGSLHPPRERPGASPREALGLEEARQGDVRLRPRCGSAELRSRHAGFQRACNARRCERAGRAGRRAYPGALVFRPSRARRQT